MSRPHLVIARAGRNSLHPTWLAGTGPRNWDLYLCPFQQLAPQEGLDCTVGEVLPGPKWTGLRQLLNGWHGWRDYDYVWLPDDDIFASRETIDSMFAFASSLSFELCAPALHESSYYAHFDTMRNRRCFARRTGFVEIMVPCFNTQALARLLPTLELSDTGWGWGLDSLWPKLLEYRGLGIIDATPVLHTRPVGTFRDPELARRVRAESDRIMADYSCAQVHSTFEAIGRDLKALDMAAPTLAARLVEGWSYLWARDPHLLPWIVGAQAPDAGWPEYPIAGSPSHAGRSLP
jgi:hypothetical protein